MSYATDREWSDRYLPRVRASVGPLLLVPAPLERDREEATDLIVLRARDMTIAVRLRRPGFAGQYPGQFTIRSHRVSGARTELAKIIKGWGDWMFYGHTDGSSDIPEWTLIDLHKLRAAFIVNPSILHAPDRSISGVRHNQDGTSFHWFHAPSIRPRIIIAESASKIASAA
jgi:hypothetical protein